MTPLQFTAPQHHHHRHHHHHYHQHHHHLHCYHHHGTKITHISFSAIHSGLYQKDACFENAVLWKYGLCKKDRLWLNEATNPVANPLILANRDRKGPVSAICRRNAFADEVISRTRSYRAAGSLSHLSSILRILWDCNVKGSYLNVLLKNVLKSWCRASFKAMTKL